uniref:Elongator complex protein 6 n=1 Tax=Salmo trutta TaxID=8032 RepID=A0A673VSW1_SALTR
MGSFTVLHVNQGVSLAQAREKGQLVFIEGLKESLGVLLQGESSKGTRAVDFLRDPSSGLRGLYDFVRDNVRSAVGGGEEWGPPVLLVDDLSVVLSLGVSVDFSHYCRATVCSELQKKKSDDERSEWLLRGLIHQCSLTLQVQGLPTGYCRDIHGQVRWITFFVQQTQKKLFQYKVHDKGASFFCQGDIQCSPVSPRWLLSASLPSVDLQSLTCHMAL